MSRINLVLFLSLSLVACGGSLDKRYLNANLADNLIIPPDLTELETESRFELPPGFAGDDPTDRSRIPVLAKVDSIELQNQSGLYWLAVEVPVENLYQVVKNFWGEEGFRLVVDEPVIGVMQTEWVYQEEGNKSQSGGWWSGLVGGEDLSASQDQYRTRIERDERAGVSRIYIAHRGTEYKHVVESGKEDTSDADVDWQFRRSEPELEVEMLSRLMVYMGLEQSQVDRQLINAKLFNPRATLNYNAEENSPYLILNDPYHIAWNRVYHQLERLNFEIDAQEFSSGIISEGFFIVNTDMVEAIEAEGLFSFGSKEPVRRQMVLILTEETHNLTKVEIENTDGDLDQSDEANEFLRLIYRHIK